MPLWLPTMRETFLGSSACHRRLIFPEANSHTIFDSSISFSQPHENGSQATCSRNSPEHAFRLFTGVPSIFSSMSRSSSTSRASWTTPATSVDHHSTPSAFETMMSDSRSHPWVYDQRFEGHFPSRILPFLYLENLAHASNVRMLRELGIQHTLCLLVNRLLPLLPEARPFPVDAPSKKLRASGVVSAHGIDTFWLQHLAAQYYPDALEATEKSTQALALSADSNN